MLGLQRFQVVVKSHPLGKNSSPLLNSVLLPIRFSCLHTLHFSYITLFSTQNSLLITSWLKAVKWRNVLEKLRRLLWRYAFQKKNRQSNVPCTLWDEDRENVVECRYGQLSSTEKIEKKKPGTIQNKITGRAKVAQLWTVNSAETSTISHLSGHFLLRLKYTYSTLIRLVAFSRFFESVSRAFRSGSRLVASVLRLPYFRL